MSYQPISKFHEALGITDTDEYSWLFLLCGSSCIGKSTFIKKNCFFESIPPSKFHDSQDNIYIKNIFLQNIILDRTMWGENSNFMKFWSLTKHFAVSSDPKHWPHKRFLENSDTKLGAIILGISYEEWLKRLYKRSPDTYEFFKSKTPKSLFTTTYTRWLKLLNNNNVSYILVNNSWENDYPILDESSFFKLIST